MASVLAVPQVWASIFPDVPESYPHREAIEVLVGLEVVNGNPDGTFSPERAVNRAEMLKMLYRSSGKQPRPVHTSCFSDVESGSWYELYVCDAADRGVVQGYNDGRFRPAQAVSRVEALKMIMEMMDIPVENVTGEARDVVKFVDVSTSAWYTKYLYRAFELRILPITGQDGARFYPDWPLLRGEAAAYIYNALGAYDRMDQAEAEKIEESGVVLEDVHEELKEIALEEEVNDGSNLVANVTKPAGPRVREVFFPFEEGGAFQKKYPVLYRFTLDQEVLASFIVKVLSGYEGGIVCRLYRLGEGGFSTEYYLGHEEGSYCTIKVALSVGDYQLQISPTVGDAQYWVRSVTNEGGDGNDGFRQAKHITKTVPRHGIMEGGDYSDWYTFTVLDDTENYTAQVSSDYSLPCLIYPLEDVDLFSFSGPQCGEEYTYPRGTYMIGVFHGNQLAKRMTYTLQLR